MKARERVNFRDRSDPGPWLQGHQPGWVQNMPRKQPLWV